MNFRLGKTIDLLIETTILGMVFITPLYFALFLRTNNVFELNKMALFKILVLIALFSTLAKYLLIKREALFFKRGAGRVLIGKKSLYLILPVIFLLSLVISVIFSVNRDLSISGLYNRQLGFSSNLFFFLFFILLIANIRTNGQIARIAKSVAFSSFVASIYGLVQAAGYDPLPWSESTQLRATSTLGQPNLLAMYILLAMPMSLYLLIRNLVFLKEIKLPYAQVKILAWWSKNFFYFLILLTNLVCLFFTYSLSGWTGLIGGTIISTIIYLLTRRGLSPEDCGGLAEKPYLSQLPPQFPDAPGRLRRGANSKGFNFTLQFGNWKIKRFFNRQNTILAAGVAAIVIISVFAVAKIQNRWVFQARLSSLINLQSASLTSRYNFWHSSLKAIFKDGGAKRLLIGYGPETQKDVLAKYYEKDWGVYEDVNVRPDRAHNLFLDILLTTGSAGLVAYLALLVLFFSIIIALSRSNNRPDFPYRKNDNGTALLSQKLVSNPLREREEAPPLERTAETPPFERGAGGGFIVSNYNVLLYCIFLSVTSYIIALQLNFTFVVGEIYFWLYLAMVMKIGAEAALAPAQIRRTSPPERKAGGGLLGKNTTSLLLTGAKKFFIIPAVAAGIFYSINNQMKLLTADHYFRELREARVANQYFGAIKMYEFIKENVPDCGYYDRQFAVIMSGWIEEFDDPLFRKFGEEKLSSILSAIKTDNYDDIYAKAVIQKALAQDDLIAEAENFQPQRSGYFESAEEEFKKVIATAPQMPGNYIELAKLYVKWGKPMEAINAYELAASKLPDLDHHDINADHKQAAERELYLIYLSIGDIYFKQNELHKAEESYKMAVTLNEKIVNAHGKLAKLHEKAGDFSRAIWYNEKAMEIDKNNFQYPLALSKIYSKLGDKEKEARYLKQAQSLNNLSF